MSEISESELHDLLYAYAEHLSCWRVGLAYGSTVLIDLGEPIARRRFMDSSAGIELLADHWQISRRDYAIYASESVTRTTAEEEIGAAFLGLRPLRTRTSLRRLRHDILFAQGLRISAWVPRDHAYKEDDDLVRYTFPNGVFVSLRISLRPKLRVYFDKSESKEHGDMWRRRHLA